MAEKDLGDGPSLELPSLGSLLRRKKARKQQDRDDATPASASAPIDAGPATDVTGEPTDDLAPTAEEFDSMTHGKTAVKNHRNEREPAPTAEADLPARDDSPETILDDTAEEPTSVATKAAKPPREPKPKKEFALPPLAARAAAALTGAVTGLLGVALTYLALRGCEAVKGTSTCGTPGYLLLLAIMIGLIVIGSALLGAWRVPDSASTSFLAVGLLAVIALLFLIEVLFSPWMVLVIPAVSIGTFTLSQWVTSLILDEAE